LSRGMSRSMPHRLCSRAPRIEMTSCGTAVPLRFPSHMSLRTPRPTLQYTLRTRAVRAPVRYEGATFRKPETTARRPVVTSCPHRRRFDAIHTCIASAGGHAGDPRIRGRGERSLRTSRGSARAAYGMVDERGVPVTGRGSRSAGSSRTGVVRSGSGARIGAYAFSARAARGCARVSVLDREATA
jgi:hypothetical protein